MRSRIRTSNAALPSELLAIYVRDHLAGAVGGLALARRAARTAPSREHGRVLARLAEEIAAELTVLRRCAAALGIPRPRLREVGALAVERAARLKLNGQLRGTSPLSPVVEIEGLMLGVTGKANSWRSLASSYAAQRLPDDIDLAALEEQALAQRRELEQVHHEVVACAVGRPMMAP